MTAPEKRPAFEPPGELVAPVAGDASMQRPISTVAGAALVLLRVAAGIVWMLSVAFGWGDEVSRWAAQMANASDDPTAADASFTGVALIVFLTVMSFVLLVEAVFGVLILRGRNFPRTVVMVFSVLSISTAFVGWWVQGQDIRISTTLVTLALDILVLLALSSRSASAYARRRQRR
ncbi:hypothetical protein [Microbacterium sp. P04]|uniref:hypothetical protein n=1 Tax=Microbacterium sp. P04 TaxID=3366947 RepID=UPI003746CBB5